VCAVLLTLAAAASAAFLLPSWEEFPMDDAYIHLVYAQNLAEQGDLFFNTRGEPGIGTSSILWTLLLAGAESVGLPMALVAKGLGILSLVAAAAAAYLLLLPIWGSWRSMACAVLVVLSGNMLWFALCGMETMLFLALGLLGLLAYRGRRWWVTGLILGLATLTRIEGAALVAAIAGLDILGQRKIGKGLVTAVAVWALLCAPWFVFLVVRTGHLLPTSGIGKHFTSQLTIREVMERSPGLGRLASLPGVIYVAAWLVFLLEFDLGGMALPPPRLTVATTVESPDYAVSIWAIVLWVAAIGPLLWAGLRRLPSPSAWKRWNLDRDRQVLLVLAAWILMHNLSYALYLPIPGTASRYAPGNHLALWMLLSAGLFALKFRPATRVFFGAVVAAIALANLAYWNGVYDANMEHMTSVRIAAARYLREELSPGDRCAAFDIGAVRYHSERPIVDLGGLIEPNAQTVFEAGTVDQYLLDARATCLVVPGRGGPTKEGWFDLLAMSGLAHSDKLALEEEALFEIGYDRWLQGFQATANYQASVVLYRIAPRGGDSLRLVPRAVACEG
jgi:hypothetical protein